MQGTRAKNHVAATTQAWQATLPATLGPRPDDSVTLPVPTLGIRGTWPVFKRWIAQWREKTRRYLPKRQGFAETWVSGRTRPSSPRHVQYLQVPKRTAVVRRTKPFLCNLSALVRLAQRVPRYLTGLTVRYP